MSQNITKILKQAQRMQSQMLKAQEELAAKQVEGTAGGGVVKVTMTGGGELVSVSLAREVVNPDDIPMLQDMIVAAYNNAHEKVKQMSEATMSGLTGGMGIPGLTV